MRLAQPLRAILLLLAVLLLCGATLLAVGAASQGYAWHEMDWNRDGSTSIAEFLRSGDIGKRQSLTAAGQPCIEYFSLKDGLPFRVDCPESRPLDGAAR
jgi:hypothetical protein